MSKLSFPAEIAHLEFLVTNYDNGLEPECERLRPPDEHVHLAASVGLLSKNDGRVSIQHLLAKRVADESWDTPIGDLAKGVTLTPEQETTILRKASNRFLDYCIAQKVASREWCEQLRTEL
jgi:hypothetical protein